MAAVCVSGYGEGYDTHHPFTQLCTKLRDDQPDIRSYSLPNAGAPRLPECTEFFKSLLQAGDISELYLHSLAVNSFKLAVDDLPAAEVDALRGTLACIFLITPGVGREVARDHFPELAEFYNPALDYQSDWRKVLELSRHKPCVLVAPDDPYLNADEVFEMKLLKAADGNPAFHWINAPWGAHHFCQHSEAALTDLLIDSIMRMRRILVHTPF